MWQLLISYKLTEVAPSKTCGHVFLSIFLQLFWETELWRTLEAPTTFNISEVWTKGPTTYTWLELYLQVLFYFKNLLPTLDSENEELFYFPNQQASLILYSLRGPCESWIRFSLVHLTLPVSYHRDLKEIDVHCGHFARTSLGKAHKFLRYIFFHSSYQRTHFPSCFASA